MIQLKAKPPLKTEIVTSRITKEQKQKALKKLKAHNKTTGQKLTMSCLVESLIDLYVGEKTK